MPKVFCISGEKGHGKSTFIANLVAYAQLETNDYSVLGFFQPRCDTGKGYDIKFLNSSDLATAADCMPLCRPSEERGWWFNEAAFETSSDYLKRLPGKIACLKEANAGKIFCVIDEVGRIEAREKKGHWPGLVKAMNKIGPDNDANVLWILSVRYDCLDLVIEELRSELMLEIDFKTKIVHPGDPIDDETIKREIDAILQ